MIWVETTKSFVEFEASLAHTKVDYLIWGCFDQQFAFALTLGLRTKFSCRYMVTADDDFFIAYSGTNLPMYINTSYKPWTSGELAAFRQLENIEVRITKA